MLQLRIFQEQFPTHVCPKRTSHRRNFQTVSQSVVNEYTARKGKHLCLVLHPPKCCRENETIVVSLKFRAALGKQFGLVFFTVSFGRNESLPIHLHQ